MAIIINRFVIPDKLISKKRFKIFILSIFCLFTSYTQAQLKVEINDSVIYKYDFFSVENLDNAEFPFNKKTFNAKKTIYTFHNDDNESRFTFYEFTLKDTMLIVNAINEQYPKKIVSPEEFGIHYFVRHNFYGKIKTIKYKKELIFLQYENKVIFLEIDDNLKSKGGGMALFTLNFGLEFDFLFDDQFHMDLYELLSRAARGSYRGM